MFRYENACTSAFSLTFHFLFHPLYEGVWGNIDE